MIDMVTKSRNIDVDKSVCSRSWFTVFGGPPQNITLINADLKGLETISDQSPHHYLTGGNMQLLRNTVRSYPAQVYAYTSTGGVDYFNQCRIFAKQHAGNSTILPTPPLSSTVLGYGVKGWNRFKPTSRNGSLAQAILELKDIPRMLESSDLSKVLRDRTKSVAQKAGNQFLNYQFGWVPLLSDIRDLLKNAHDAQKRMDQLARDNGKWVRRRGSVYQNTSSTATVSTGAFSSPTMVSPLYWGGVKSETQHRTQTSWQRYWFSARFKYWIEPNPIGRLDKFLQAEHLNAILYGTDLSPSLVYELIPWSWLVDWFSSSGDAIANYFEDSADNLVADYAYVMGNTMSVDDYVVTGKTINGVTYTTRQSYLLETKTRIAAYPYGFFAIEPALTLRQTGILGALGLMKHRKLV
jgi:hypothetical protein